MPIRTGEQALDFAEVRAEFGLPADYPAQALAEAERVTLGGRAHRDGDREDATHLALVTIDPPGSKDLDQAVLAERRGAVELQLPEQEIEPDTDGGWRLAVRLRREAEEWNAEMSILTGICAARLMLDAGIGILRTLPTPDPEAVAALHRMARALDISWQDGHSPARVLAGLDPDHPASLAFHLDATRLLRGAGYTAFDGAEPAVSGHAGIGAPYAHVTAPLRRLVDRFAAEVCLAVSAGRSVPGWVRAALPELPALMATSDTLATRVERTCLDQVQAWVLADRVGEEFDAV